MAKAENSTTTKPTAFLTAVARVNELDEVHGYFFRLHHPNRDAFERDGWPDNGAG
jgi:hypothetical protein